MTGGVTFKNGLKVYPFSSFEELLEFSDKQNKILVAINAEKILHATPLTKRIINENIGFCDGTGAVMAMKSNGISAVKIAGCELWLKIISAKYKTSSFYLVGSTQEVIELTVDKLCEEFPGINIAGYRNGYINSEEEKKNLIKDIVAKQPDVVFVAMGSPKQELLMEELKQCHSALYQGLGGSFDVYVGKVKRAPKWYVNHNIEFLYRLLKQPKRIKRQIHLLKFLYLVKTKHI